MQDHETIQFCQIIAPRIPRLEQFFIENPPPQVWDPARAEAYARALRLALEALGEHVFNLNLSSLHLSVLPSEIGFFPNLRRLDLSENELRVIRPGGLSRCRHLQMLDLSNNRLKSLPADCADLRVSDLRLSSSGLSATDSHQRWSHTVLLVATVVCAILAMIPSTRLIGSLCSRSWTLLSSVNSCMWNWGAESAIGRIADVAKVAVCALSLAAALTCSLQLGAAALIADGCLQIVQGILACMPRIGGDIDDALIIFNYALAVMSSLLGALANLGSREKAWIGAGLFSCLRCWGLGFVAAVKTQHDHTVAEIAADCIDAVCCFVLGFLSIESMDQVLGTREIRSDGRIITRPGLSAQESFLLPITPITVMPKNRQAGSLRRYVKA